MRPARPSVTLTHSALRLGLAPAASPCPPPPRARAQRLPSFLDRLDADLQRSTSELSDTQHVLASAQSHVREVMGDRATLPELDLDSPGAAARNGEVMQAWLRDLSDVLPDLFAAMEGDVRELKGVLQPSIQPRGSASAQR